MITNENVLDELLAVIRAAVNARSLPEGLRSKLKQKLDAVETRNTALVLEREGEIPKNAYYVVKGYVTIIGYDEELNEYVSRLYGPGTIVAQRCFMYQRLSRYTVIASKRALVWAVSAGVMNEIYEELPGMREIALQVSDHYEDRKRRARELLISLNLEQRVLMFYKRNVLLLPAVRSVVCDEAVASYLGLPKYQLKRKRTKLICKGILKVPARW